MDHSIQFFKQGKSCKTGDLNAHKWYIRLCGSIIYHADKFITGMIKILFAFFSFNAIIKYYLHSIFFESVSNSNILLQRFSPDKLPEDRIPDQWFYKRKIPSYCRRCQPGSYFYQPGFSHQGKKKMSLF